MKRILALFAVATALLLAACAAGVTQPAESSPAPVTPSPATASASATPQPSPSEPAIEKTMTVSSPGIADGFIDPKFGSYGSVNKKGIPTLSIPIEIQDAPDGTVCFALYMDDPDSEPLCGYRWVHWMAVDFTETSLPEGLSAEKTWEAAQGKNDFGTAGYGGPTPPDKDHTYVVTVYALDAPTGLADGFTKEEFASAIEGHVLAKAVIEGVYKK